MMWVATQTQPDVSFDVCRMSNTGKYLKVKLLFKANKSLLILQLKTGSISSSKNRGKKRYVYLFKKLG